MQEQIMNDGHHGPETADAEAPDAGRIRELNDSFRRSFVGGRIVITAGVSALPDRVRGAVITAVRAFDTFTADDDPNREHDFGAVTVEGKKFFWKIDAFDRSMRVHSPDAADPAVTVRVLTVMHATEW